MFGALNRFISRLDSDSPSRDSDSHGAFGFQVLRNKNDDIPIEPWFDFIIGINGRQIDDPDPALFATEVRNCAGTTVTLTLWTAKGQTTRTLSIPVPPTTHTLGLTLQWTPLTSTHDTWHILDVLPSSPASLAGLLPYGDYIIGTPSGIVRGEAGLGELVEDHLSRPLKLYVYNHEYDVTRLVSITPSRGWGGEGALGCVLGYGALHRLPAVLAEPPQGRGEVLFETAAAAAAAATSSNDKEEEEAQPSSSSSTTTTPNPTFVPLNAPLSLPNPNQSTTTTTTAPPPVPLIPSTTSPSISTSSPSTHPRSTRHHNKPRHQHAHAAISPQKAFDEYFKEGEQRSREEDYVPSTPAAGKGGLPPPPKAGTSVLPSPPPPPPAAAEVVGSGMGARAEAEEDEA
ncbi:hypothetical protein MMC16_002529 [Acarospora aff. strigata]|nr:hypothetical protein [Acarospora aff. strigata]